ncbi:hypothetical protein B0H66DRAFT_397756 [Apodospora peruviana]|uniref:Uncharacterized protein n=1 Tax=Apodospora peruviana TaxID=516989 RepID=A0AAE0LYH2_9PEZI|nr:hypothetical protein B0H66DRAFT_397756 [Apodospora peruviana]
MPSSQSSRHSSSQSTSSRDSRSRRSNDSYGSQSTAPTSIYSNPRPSDLKTLRSSSGSHEASKPQQRQAYARRDDVSPDTSLYPRSSVETYASTTASSQDIDHMDVDESPLEYEYSSIPPLPVYRREVVEPNVRASTPQDFAKLFPSLNRLTIRHDEFTSDGNMNLRVDTVVTGRRRTAIQLFHLRMYDLAKREFSLRRYCRDSGREVCNSKRKYTDPAAAKQAKPKAVASPKEDNQRPTLKRSMTTAIKTLSGGRPVLRRAQSGMAVLNGNRPDSSDSSCDGDDEYFNDRSNLSRLSLDSRGAKAKTQRPLPTNTIKLEFSNYARVDVHRRGGKNNKRYEFDWWGHRYSWKRSFDKQLGIVSFHLVRDGNAGAPVAHIVPETRSPSQVLADENAGGWIPPCFMWIADETIVDAVTDVADVIMATGLMALVDDCIKERWQTKKVHRIPVPMTSKTVNLGYVGPRALIQHVFGRRYSNDHSSSPSSPLRFASPIAAC